MFVFQKFLSWNNYLFALIKLSGKLEQKVQTESDNMKIFTLFVNYSVIASFNKIKAWM